MGAAGDETGSRWCRTFGSCQSDAAPATVAEQRTRPPRTTRQPLRAPGSTGTRGKATVPGHARGQLGSPETGLAFVPAARWALATLGPSLDLRFPPPTAGVPPNPAGVQGETA